MKRIILNVLIIAIGLFLAYRIHRTNSIRNMGVKKTFDTVVGYQTTTESDIKKRNRFYNFLKKLADYTSSLRFLDLTKKQLEKVEYISIRVQMNISGVVLDAVQIGSLIKLLELICITVVTPRRLFG